MLTYNDKEKSKTKQIITDIIRDNTDFSQRMKYQYSLTSRNKLRSMYTGAFTYKNQPYVMEASIDYSSADDLKSQKFIFIFIQLYSNLSYQKHLKNTPSYETRTYESIVEEAKKQPQPIIYNWW